jgi:Helix-turn-helix domain
MKKKKVLAAAGARKKATLDELMDIPTAAKRLGGVSPDSVRLWLKQGRIQKTKVGDRVMVSVRALQDFLEACREPSRGEAAS